MTEHPINPPPELVREWATANGTSYEDLSALCQNIATQAAQWGADAELEACCEWVDWKWSGIKSRELRASRRLKPPSLKEQALMGLSRIESTGEFFSDGMKDLATIRRALEQLND